MTAGAGPGPSLDARPPLAVPLLAALSLTAMVLHLLVLERYGWFRDEFYYVACADRLAWGYVDHPPFSIAVLTAWKTFFGQSLASIRIVPALCDAAVVVMAGLFAREAGGGRWAQALAALAALVTPVYLGITRFYSMNAFDLLVWPVAMLLLVRVLRSGAMTTWAWLGLALGLGLLNKISVLWLIAGLGVGLLLTRERRVLVSRGPWLAAAIAAALFLPHVVWQIAHDWPTLEFMRNATGKKMVATAFGQFWTQQVLIMNPAALPVWLTGIVACLFAFRGTRWRVIGIAWLVTAAILIAGGRSRASYLAPAYLPLLAVGAAAAEHALRGRGRWIFAALTLLVLSGGVLIAPLALPLFPVERYLDHARALGVAPSAEERHRMGPLPQGYADMFGWEEMVGEVARVYLSLPSGERARCAVYGQNYGEAGAVEVLGRRLGLPRAISGHNNFWLWGPGPDPEVVIVIGGEAEDHLQSFERVEQAGTVPHAPYAMPYEQDLPIFVCRGLRMPVADLWPRTKHYN